MSKNSKRKARRARAGGERVVKPGPVKSEKLTLWQERLALSDADWAGETMKMDEREAIYKGSRKLNPLVKNDSNKEEATHVRNIVFENIESMVSSVTPNPKVTAIHQEDEPLAEIIENMIRNLMDKLPSETNNDLAERTVPIQGGVLFHEEWDDRKRTHDAIGAFCDTVVHPKQLAPQPGVYTDIEDMNWFILKIPTSKTDVWREFGIDVSMEGDSEPQIRTSGGTTTADEMLTKYIGYERNEDGGIDKYVWVNNVELLDLPNYQARRQPACKKCGRLRPLPGQIISGLRQHGNLMPDPSRGFGGSLAEAAMQEQLAGHAVAQQMAEKAMMPPDESGMLMEGMELAEGEEPEQRYDDGPCPWCGGEEWVSEVYEYERVILPIERNFGAPIPGEHMGKDEEGNPAMVPTLIPFYKPDIYPVILQKNVSIFGQLLGNSDVDVIRDQQNTVNRMEKKIIDRLLKAGTRITLPDDARLRMDPRDGDIWYLKNIADKQMIGVYEFSGDLHFELAYLSQVYEEARQILGITDSFQGRRDATATSGKSKEFSAAQAAGRMESKRVMKNAAYAKKFELMFKFMLAYADEPRPVVYKDFKGQTVYKEFNRYDFLKKDASGWYWNTDFLFSVDPAGSLASNREAMWQENRMNLQTGAFGPPEATETLILFWGKMELDHYPGAAATKKYLEDKLEKEQQQAMQMQQMQLQMMMRQQGGMPGGAPGGGGMMPPNMPTGAAM